MQTGRYDGKPLLRLLECYVLAAIGELQQQDVETLTALQPKLSSVYGVEGDWQGIISSVMKFPSEMPELIRQVWRKNEENTRQRGLMIDAQKFAEQFVDENFV